MEIDERFRAYASIHSIPEEERKDKRVVRLHDSNLEGQSLGFQGVVLYPGRQQTIAKPSAFRDKP